MGRHKPSGTEERVPTNLERSQLHLEQSRRQFSQPGLVGDLGGAMQAEVLSNLKDLPSKSTLSKRQITIDAAFMCLDFILTAFLLFVCQIGVA